MRRGDMVDSPGPWGNSCGWLGLWAEGGKELVRGVPCPSVNRNQCAHVLHEERAQGIEKKYKCRVHKGTRARGTGTWRTIADQTRIRQRIGDRVAGETFETTGGCLLASIPGPPPFKPHSKSPSFHTSTKSHEHITHSTQPLLPSQSGWLFCGRGSPQPPLDG